MEKAFWSDLSFVRRSRERSIILRLLSEPRTPTELKKEAKMHISNVSRTLRSLVKRKLITCLTPKEIRGRYYALTIRGKEIFSKLV